MKLILIGRSGSGKTSVIESLMGSSISSEGNTQTVTRFGPPVVIAETLGFFSGKHDLHACTMKLAQCVYSFNPGPDAFGLVISIGRFTAEERNMIDIFQEVYGKEVCQFTIIIFTRLDDLLYDDVPLDEFLKDSTQELRDLLTRCGGRYIAFDNSGSWESRKGYAESLVSMMNILQTRNKNTVYTVEMLEKAKIIQTEREKEESNKKEESRRQLKEEMKASMRQELQAQIRQDITEKLMKEDQERRRMVTTVPGKDRGKQKQRDQLSLQMPIREESFRRQPDHSSLRNQFDLPKLKVEHQTSCDTKLILVGRSGSGKSSVIESLMGSPLSSKSQTQAVNRFGSSIFIAESLGFFSPDHDLQACEMKLAECVYSFNPGPHAFGLVIRIGRFTAEEIKMINIFRETYGEDVFRFTIIIFTRLDDLLYDGVSLDEFLKHCTPELGNLLNRCGGRYVGFDNSGTWEARKGYAEALVSMMKMLQTQNKHSIYTWNMLEKARVIQMKKEEEELKQKEESRRQLKEEMKASMRQELQEQIREDITVKLMKEDQEQRMMVRTARGKEADTTMQHGKLISCKNLVHEEKTDQHSNPQNLSNVSKVNMDEQLTRQQLKPPQPIAEGTRRKPIVYTKQRDQSGVCTEHTAESSSPKKEKKKPKPRGPKPELKPKSEKLKKKKGNKSGAKEGPSTPTTTNTTHQLEPGLTDTPRRTGFIGRLISFWESFRS